MKKLIPTYRVKNIFEMDIKSIIQRGFKYIFLDLDNTLDSYRVKSPSDRVKQLIVSYKQNGLTPIIISNNNSERVHNYGKELDIDVYCSMGKPFKRKLNRLIKEHNFPKDEILMIGDQIFTDVWGGNNVNVTTILVEPIVKEDQFVTKIKRPLEKVFKKRLTKKKLSKEWGN